MHIQMRKGPLLAHASEGPTHSGRRHSYSQLLGQQADAVAEPGMEPHHRPRAQQSLGLQGIAPAMRQLQCSVLKRKGAATQQLLPLLDFASAAANTWSGKHHWGKLTSVFGRCGAAQGPQTFLQWQNGKQKLGHRRFSPTDFRVCDLQSPYAHARSDAIACASNVCHTKLHQLHDQYEQVNTAQYRLSAHNNFTVAAASSRLPSLLLLTWPQNLGDQENDTQQQADAASDQVRNAQEGVVAAKPVRGAQHDALLAVELVSVPAVVDGDLEDVTSCKVFVKLAPQLAEPRQGSCAHPHHQPLILVEGDLLLCVVIDQIIAASQAVEDRVEVIPILAAKAVPYIRW